MNFVDRDLRREQEEAEIRRAWAGRPCCDDPDRWFADETIEQVWAAQKECGQCPAIALCAERALAQIEQGTTPTYGVFASVLMPTLDSSYARHTLSAVVKRLRQVAATGRQAPLATRRAVNRRLTGNGTEAADGIEKIRVAVIELHDGGLSYSEVGAKLGISKDAAAAMYRRSAKRAGEVAA